MATIWLSRRKYLSEKNRVCLSDIIAFIFYKDNVSVTIVDRDGKSYIQYCSHDDRVARQFTATIETYMSNNLNGSFAGRDYLVGYAGLKKSNWNIIVSTPSEVVTSMLFNTVKKIPDWCWLSCSLLRQGWLFCRHVSQTTGAACAAGSEPMTVSRRQRNSLPSGPAYP